MHHLGVILFFAWLIVLGLIFLWLLKPSKNTGIDEKNDGSTLHFLGSAMPGSILGGRRHKHHIGRI